jgi:winged helix DNA-binding protein
MLHIDAAQALAFRVAGHRLHRRTDPLTAIAAACGLQESPPGWAPVALHARSNGTLEDVADDVVTVNAMRGAPYIVPRADVRVFTTALVPDDDGLKSLVGTAPSREVTEAGFTVREALDRIAGAARDGLSGGPLDRDAFHQALRERLPDGLLPWCRGCQSHHVRPGFWRALGPLGVTAYDGKARWALASDPPRWAVAGEDAGAELVRRFLRAYGPGTHTQLAKWGQTAPAHAKALFAAVGDELEPVEVDGRRAWILADDVARLQDPPAARGVRLLGGFDPYVAQPDREALVPDRALRTKLFPAVGRPGIVLHDGVLTGLWKGRRKGDTLQVEVDWLTGAAEVDIAAQAAAVARLRGCARARMVPS